MDFRRCERKGIGSFYLKFEPVDDDCANYKEALEADSVGGVRCSVEGGGMVSSSVQIY